MVFCTVMASNKSIGHISSLPIHMSAMKTTFTIKGEVEVMSPEPSPTLLRPEATSNKTCGTF